MTLRTTLPQFQSTHPVRGATSAAGLFSGVVLHFNPRTPCGVRRDRQQIVCPAVEISIHAPRAGCDAGDLPGHGLERISIHAPRAGCDTPGPITSAAFRYFNPRTPCGVRLQLIGEAVKTVGISIHAPRAGCDVVAMAAPPYAGAFQSTHPVRGATERVVRLSTMVMNFNPRTPCGVRPPDAGAYCCPDAISIHAPRAGCDLDDLHAANGVVVISIHAPRAGCDQNSRPPPAGLPISIHAPRAGCDVERL